MSSDNMDNIDSKIDYKSLYYTLYDNTLSMHYTLDKYFCIVAVNRFGAENLGYKPEEMISQKFTNFIHPEYHKNITEQLGFCWDSPGQILQWEFKMSRRDGQIVWIKDSARTIESSNPNNILISCEDITVKKEAEQSVDEIITSYKIESLSRLAGGIGHDFNNLLTGILGNLSLIKTHLNNDHISYEKIVEIENTSIMAKELAEKLFVFSTGGEPYKSPQSVYNLLNQSLQTENTDGNVTFDIKRHDHSDTINADSEQIKQVFHNIILNAKQAILGSGEISINLENIIINGKSSLPLSEGSYIVVSFTDRGSGIAADELTKVFDPYYSTKPDCVGLGLSIASAIIKNHDGHIEIDSEEGIQTTVKVYLPSVDDNSSDGEQQKLQRPQAKSEEVLDGKLLTDKRVLVMDDEDFIRKVAGNILEHLGCEVDFAVDGQEAAEKYRAGFNTDNSFDFVLLDLTVPEGLGAEDSIKLLREVDPEVKAIVSSGYINDPVMANYKDYGFLGMIKKPYEIEDFIKSFYDLLDLDNN